MMSSWSSDRNCLKWLGAEWQRRYPTSVSGCHKHTSVHIWQPYPQWTRWTQPHTKYKQAREEDKISSSFFVTTAAHLKSVSNILRNSCESHSHLVRTVTIRQWNSWAFAGVCMYSLVYIAWGGWDGEVCGGVTGKGYIIWNVNDYLLYQILC